GCRAGRRSVTVRRASAPPAADPLDGELAIRRAGLHGQGRSRMPRRAQRDHAAGPLGQVPGYSPALDPPSRVNLPWNFSGTTGHRLRMLYGITELAPAVPESTVVARAGARPHRGCRAVGSSA